MTKRQKKKLDQKQEMIKRDSTEKETLTYRTSNPVQGLQPLSRPMQYILERQINHYIQKQETEGNFSIDEDYWNGIARDILGCADPTAVLIVAAPAGYGKTVFLTAFILAIIWCFVHHPEFELEFSGVIISFQKVEDLNRLGEMVTELFPDEDAYVALQGWTQSGKEKGFCRNEEVLRFEDCKGKSCPFAGSCKIRSFPAMAPKAFVVGITHMRFKMLQGSSMMDQIINRTLPDGSIRERRYIIFDENPNLARISAMSLKTLNQAAEEFDNLISKGLSSDKTAFSREKALSFGLSSVFQHLRQMTQVQPEDGSQPMEVKMGICAIKPADYTEQRDCYVRLTDMLACRNAATPTIQELTNVGNRLYRGEPCIFCKNAGFTVYDIQPAKLEFQNQHVIVFDATAGIDADYAALSGATYLPVPEQRCMDHVTFFIHQAPEFEVTRKRLYESWRLPLFASYICDILHHFPEKTFICTYSKIARILYQQLEAMLPPELLPLVKTMPGKNEEMLPYIFGTNGSNAFNSCTQMIMLSTPTLNPDTYLTQACAAFGTERIMEELRKLEAEGYYMLQSWDCMKLPSVYEYAVRNTVTRWYQEIYRLAIRNRENQQPIYIHLFAPKEPELKMLLGLFPGSKIQQIKEVPQYFHIGKGSARQYQGEKTAFGRLAAYIQNGAAFPRRVSEIRNELDISEAVWKDLMRDSRVKLLLEGNGIVCTGRGANRCWTHQAEQEKSSESDCA